MIQKLQTSPDPSYRRMNVLKIFVAAVLGLAASLVSFDFNRYSHAVHATNPEVRLVALNNYLKQAVFFAKNAESNASSTEMEIESAAWSVASTPCDAKEWKAKLWEYLESDIRHAHEEQAKILIDQLERRLDDDAWEKINAPSNSKDNLERINQYLSGNTIKVHKTEACEMRKHLLKKDELGQ